MTATGYSDPIAITPPRHPGSIRRTSHIDMTQQPGGGVHLAGVARDLETGDERSEVVAEATLDALLDGTHAVRSLTTTPARPVDALVGLVAKHGFRAAVDAAVPADRDQSTPLYLLLDELPVAALISGYVLLYRGDLTGRMTGAGPREDICAGWRSDGTMMVSIRTKGYLPVPYGPPANDLVPADDPLAWHDMGPLAPETMRRQRLVEVTHGSPLLVFAMFRDSHADADGTTTILHEYSLTADLDPDTLILSQATARPGVLPWPECPDAAASAMRLDGHPADELRAYVRSELSGTSTCTHLNDLLRSLADVAPLARRVVATRR